MNARIESTAPGEEDPISQPPESSADRVLVRDCLAGDGIAWYMLHRRYHERLVGIIRRQLYPGTPDRLNAAEQIAAEVWSSLFEGDGHRLRLWDWRRKPFLTYLAGLSKQQVQLYARREKNRKARNAPLPASLAMDADALLFSIGAELADFLPTLTPREREFVERCRLQPGAGSDQRGFSPANQRKLTQQVVRQLRKHLSGD